MLTDVLIHGLVYGAVLSVVTSVMIFASLFYNPEIWLHDFPPDIQAKYGPASAQSLRQRRIVTVPFMLIFFGILAAAVINLPAATGRAPTYLDLFLTLYIPFFTFNLVDLLLIDWLGILIQPRALILPGTEGLAGYRDYAFHFRGFLKGTVGGLLGSLVLAALAYAAFAIF